MEAIEASATLRFHRISPFKTRLVADMVRGRKVEEAMSILAFSNKKGARVLLKLIKSAVANAEEKKVEDTGILTISGVWVSEGPKYRRYLPRARGRADTIKRPTSHITVVLREDLQAKIEEAKRRAEEEAKRAKKRAAKKKDAQAAPAEESKAAPGKEGKPGSEEKGAAPARKKSSAKKKES